MSRKFSKRKVSVAKHDEFLASLMTRDDLDELDDIDLACGDYDPPARRNRHEIRGISNLLDDIARQDCLRIIDSMLGPQGRELFLKQPQPALGDRTGAQLLDCDPAGLLRRLRMLERESEVMDD